MTKKAVMPVADTTGDANDDWIKKADPEVAAEERKIHEELQEKLDKERKGNDA